MTLNSEDKKTLSDLRFDKASEFLDDARANFKEARTKTSISRSYYAALNAVRALLILEGVDSEKHGGAITILSLRFIKTGLLPVEIAKSMKLLLSRRTDVDYGDFESIDTADAQDSIDKAEDILRRINDVRKKMIDELSV
jgi:hypothetical protein